MRSLHLSQAAIRIFRRSYSAQSLARSTARSSNGDAAAGAHARLKARIPPCSWDTHMHVVDLDKFPVPSSSTDRDVHTKSKPRETNRNDNVDKTARANSSGLSRHGPHGRAQYKPSNHTLAQAQESLSQLGISNMVLVQPSFYMFDNSCILSALKSVGKDHARAVVQFDPLNIAHTDQISAWHDIGVRGVLLNYRSLGARVDDPAVLRDTLAAYHDLIGRLGWVVQIYLSMEEMPVLERAISGLGDIKICIDHVAHPSGEEIANAKTAVQLRGFAALKRLLLDGNTWVKLSALYRLHVDPRHPLVSDLIWEVVKLRPDRCVFATDWPHTRYDGIDVGPYLETVLDILDEEHVPLERVLVKNAQCLFDC